VDFPVEADEHEETASIKELLEYLARGLVEQPDRVRVGEVHDDDALVLELSVADDDYGNVIGRGGKTASALRTVIKSAAAKRNRRVFVDIVDG
jgi:uncharacterized protein